MKNLWKGVNVKDELIIKNVCILIGEKSVIIIPNMENSIDYLNFFATLRFFFEDNFEKTSVFGVFLDKVLCVVKRKAREDFYKNFSHEKLLSILNGENKEAYYTSDDNLEKLIGIEIRLKSNTESWFVKERVFGELNIFIKKEKKKIINAG